MKKFLLILLLLILTGCADYKELNDLGIATSIGIEYKDNMFYLTTQLVNVKNEKEPLIYETSGVSIDESLAKLSEVSNKRLFISHLKALIIDESVLENKAEFYDYFLRSTENKMNFYIYVTSNDIKPKDILNIKEQNETSSMVLDKILDFNETAYSSSIKLEFINMVKNNLEYGINNVYPIVSIKDNKLLLDESISYNYDNKKLLLDSNQTISYNILRNNIKNTLLQINCDDKSFSIEINDIKTKYKIKENTFIFDIKASSTLSNYKCNYDLNKKENIEHLNKLSEEFINIKIQKLINYSIDNNNDFLGINNYIYKHKNKNIKKNENYDLLLKNYIFKTTVKLDITNTGDERKKAERNENE